MVNSDGSLYVGTTEDGRKDNLKKSFGSPNSSDWGSTKGYFKVNYTWLNDYNADSGYYGNPTVKDTQWNNLFNPGSFPLWFPSGGKPTKP